MIRHLSDDDALSVVGWMGFRTRDAGLLSSALARPRAGHGGTDVYETLPAKAAALLESVARNHSLYDGNKRVAWLLTLLFLSRNRVRHTLTADEAVAHVVAVASGAMGLEASTAVFAAHVEPFA